ncbi:MAG TPA: response regulator transcription factor [Dehalococcoidia bacterium]|jgi:DNA-binding NarL/FixJ family response regulator|nr:response regulator transcription factor [Dehalococcoidia bacterium]
MNAPIRLLLADEQKLYRDGLTTVFSRCGDIKVVGQARTGSEACEKARRARPDVVLIDTRIPEMDGVSAMRSILQELPSTRVAVLTESRSPTDLLDAVKAGARGYITKDVTIQTLIDAIKRIAAGEAVIMPNMASRLLDEFTAMARTRDHEAEALETDSAKVTERERDVLELLVQGATNRDIARKLLITENTVKVHLRNILEKLHLRNRQQAAAFAISSGLVRLSREEAVARQR